MLVPPSSPPATPGEVNYLAWWLIHYNFRFGAPIFSLMPTANCEEQVHHAGHCSQHPKLSKNCHPHATISKIRPDLDSTTPFPPPGVKTSQLRVSFCTKRGGIRHQMRKSSSFSENFQKITAQNDNLQNSPRIDPPSPQSSTDRSAQTSRLDGVEIWHSARKCHGGVRLLNLLKIGWGVATDRAVGRRGVGKAAICNKNLRPPDFHSVWANFETKADET